MRAELSNILAPHNRQNMSVKKKYILFRRLSFVKAESGILQPFTCKKSDVFFEPGIPVFRLKKILFEEIVIYLYNFITSCVDIRPAAFYNTILRSEDFINNVFIIKENTMSDNNSTSDIALSLRKFLAPEIVYGSKSLELAGRHALNFGAEKILIVTDPGVQESGWTSKVEKSVNEAGISYVIYNDITPNPKDTEVMAGAEMYLDNNCDLIIAVGGGSPMDCAKGIGAVAGNPGNIVEFEGVDAIPNPGPPLIFIPTTAGSSADVSQFAIINDTSRKIKIAIISKMVIPDIALVDPLTTVSMSPELTAATGMDALCHSFEAYVSNASSPITDMAAVSSIKLIFENLLMACENPDNIICRDNMMMASLMAGLAFSNASLGMVHAMAHSLGGYFGLPHGECNAVLLEEVIKYNFKAAGSKYGGLLPVIGKNNKECGDSEKLAILVDEIASLRKKIGITQRLSEMGITLNDIPMLADYASSDPCMATNPCAADASDIEKIYRGVL